MHEWEGAGTGGHGFSCAEKPYKWNGLQVLKQRLNPGYFSYFFAALLKACPPGFSFYRPSTLHLRFGMPRRTANAPLRQSTSTASPLLAINLISDSSGT